MLKGDREIYVSTIQYVIDAVTEAGQVCILKSSQPTGAAVGQGINASAPVATPVGTGSPASGSKVIGVALADVVSIDTTRQHRNYFRAEQLVNEPTELLRNGRVLTNRVNGTPAAGDPAYVGSGGNFQNSQVNAIAAVGEFVTSKDADGYANVYVKLV